jgi:hypothetical protein
VTVQALKRRFHELNARLDEVESTRTVAKSGHEEVNTGLLGAWRVNAANLIKQACGAESVHYEEWQEVQKSPNMSSYRNMVRLKAVFLAAKDDYEGGYLRSIRSLVHAELFDDELEQARELLASGYTVAAAVVARVVLETTLRTLCVNNGIPVRTPDGKSVKLDKMNADLSKAGVYNVLVQKQVTWLADIGHKAAHGDVGGFKDADVGDMIAQVERFVRDHT